MFTLQIDTKNKRYILIGFFLLITVGFVYVLNLTHIKNEEQKIKANQEIFYKFGKVENQPPDSIMKNRVVRGELISLTDTYITLKTEITWPEVRNVQDIVFNLADNTRFICWPSAVQGTDGSRIMLRDSLFTVSDESLLTINGEKYLLAEDAKKKLIKGTYLILALRDTYVYKGVNTIYQVAIVGCQDE